MPLYVLNQTEIDILKEVIADWRRRHTRTWTAPPDEVFGQSPSVYVAWPPENGIPALTVVGDVGPDGGRDQPGSAECDIYRIDNLASTPDLQAVSDLTKVVYNLTESDIPRRWIAVQRTAFGQWVALLSDPMVLRWGKLDAEMAAGATNGTVSLWQKTDGGWDGWDEDSTENWTGVHAPPILPSGTLDSGNWVLVGEVNGRRVVLLTEC